MSKIEQLIQQLCPQGVEFKRLGEVFTQFNGMTGVSKKWEESGNCVFIDYLNAYNNIKIDTTKLCNATVKRFNQQVLRKGDVLFTTASEVPDECAISSVIEDDIVDGVFLDDHLFGLRVKEEYNNKIVIGYLKYIFRSTEFRSTIKKVVRGVTRFYISKNDFMNLSIPLPPLAVQQEIVRILDAFTQLEAELEAELKARKQQYAYYRDSLLSFDPDDPNVQWKRLGEVGTFTYGYTAKAQEEGDARFIRITDITESGCLNPDNARYITLSEESKKYLAKKGDLLLARTGATYGKTLYMQDDIQAVYASFLIKIVLDNSLITNRYYWHFSKSTFYWQQAEKLVTKGGQEQFNANVVSRILIPLPPLPVQEEIVEKLDKFEALTSDLQSGLPAEIEARRKQYEHYRDRLLTFKRKQ